MVDTPKKSSKNAKTHAKGANRNSIDPDADDTGSTAKDPGAQEAEEALSGEVSTPGGATQDDDEKTSKPKVWEAQFPVICIGASAGGLDPLQNFFANLGDMPCCAYVVITHMEEARNSEASFEVQMTARTNVAFVERCATDMRTKSKRSVRRTLRYRQSSASVVPASRKPAWFVGDSSTIEFEACFVCSTRRICRRGARTTMFGHAVVSEFLGEAGHGRPYAGTL